MYTTSESFKSTVVENTREWNIYIDMVLSNGTPLRLTKEDLALGTFSFKEGSTCGNTIQVGSTYSNSVTFTLENSDGKFKDMDFYGASVRPFVGLWLDAIQDFEYVPLGEFFVTEPTRRLASIPIVCFDTMSKLNVEFDFSTMLFPTKASTVLATLTEQTGISVTEQFIGEVATLEQSIGSFPTNSPTCRDVLAGIGILLKRNLRFNREGSLESFWYGATEGATDPSTRVGNSSYGDSEVQITGVYIEDAFGNVFSSGTGEYPVQLPTSPVIQNSDMAQPLLDSILVQLQSIPCRLQNITWIGNPAVQAGDILMSKSTPAGDLLTPVMISTYKFAGTCILEFCSPSAESASQLTSTERQLRSVFDKTVKDRTELETAIEQSSGEIQLRVSEISQQSNQIENALAGQQEKIAGLESDMVSIREEVALKLSKEDVTIQITKAIDGINSITTETGFTFNSEGMNVSQSGEELQNTVTIKGMYVRRVVSGQTDTVLAVDSNGVKGLNITAKQYLMAGSHARFEDYMENRTGCFYIGKASGG